jgi:hypothetical protein
MMVRMIKSLTRKGGVPMDKVGVNRSKKSLIKGGNHG